MTEDADEPQPAAPSRGALAASTRRALRAGHRGAGAPSAPADDEASLETLDASPATEPAEPEVEDETVTVRLAKPVPVEDVPVEDVPVEDVPVEDVKRVPATAVGKPARTPSTARGRRSALLTAGCAVFAVAALVFAVVAGVLWWTAGHSAQHALGVARGQVLDDAQLAIVTVNTSDYHRPSAALSNWLDASTGSLHSQFSQSRTAAVKLLAEAKTVTKATVLDEAVTSLDLSKGTASVLASVNVTRTHDGATSTVRNRFRATMTRVGGQWKLSNLTVVAVSLS